MVLVKTHPTPTLLVVDLVVVDRMEQHLVDLLRIQQQTQVLQSTVMLEQTTVRSTQIVVVAVVVLVLLVVSQEELVLMVE